MSEQRFELPYWISNNGDGSASINLEKSKQRAERQDELQTEGWGEQCNGAIELILVDGVLYYEDYVYVDGKYQMVRVKVPLAGETVDDDLSDLDEVDSDEDEDEDFEDID